MKVHELKIEDKYFDAIRFNLKNFEIRFNDRDFKVGDRLILHNIRTGEFLAVEIIYMLSHEEFKGIAEGYVALSLRKMFS